MLTLLPLALLANSTESSETFTAGAWEGQCIDERRGQCTKYEAVIDGPVALVFQRDAQSIEIFIKPSDCGAALRSVPVDPSFSPTTMKYLIRGRIVLAMRGCGSALPIPDLETEDLAELLRLTEGVTG